MKRLIIFVTVCFLFACSSDQEPLPGQGKFWLIQDTTVIDTRSGSVVPHQSVVIDGDKISAVGATADVVAPAGASVIDGSGKYLIPGLWDMHIHTAGVEDTTKAMLPLLIANGVTGARSMAADCHIKSGDCGEPIPAFQVFDGWRQQIASGEMVGPRLVGSSYYTNGPASVEESSIENPATAEDARGYARLLKGRGVDLIKVYGGMYREAYFAMADESKELGLEFGGEIPLTVRVTEASDAGHSTIEHAMGFLEQCSANEEVQRRKLIGSYDYAGAFWHVMLELAEDFDEQECQRVYAHVAGNGTWSVPTLNVWAFYDGIRSQRGEWREDPNLKYVPRGEVEIWELLEEDYFGEIPDYKRVMQPFFRKMFQVAGDSYKAGIPVMAGSDAGEYGVIWGFSLHTELQHMVEAGMTEADALQAATLNPARYRGLEDLLGTVENGKLADLVLLTANPLEDISNTNAIDTVIANGRVFTRSDLDELLRNVEAYSRSTREGNSSIAN
ncbi:amidohydrolase family protein [Microbulbifer agarilyticus]